MFDIYFSPEYPSCPPQVLITTTGEFLQGHLQLNNIQHSDRV